MVYAIYNKENMIITKLSLEKPQDISSYEEIVKTDNLKLGDEVSNQITIHEISDGEIVSYSAYRVAPDIKELLDRNRELEDRLRLVNQAIDDLIFGGIL